MIFDQRRFIALLKEAGKRAPHVGSGLIGQGLNFIAMLLPVFFGKVEQLAFLVAASAVAGVCAFTFTWSYASVYPGIVRERDAAVASVASAYLLVVATFILLVAAMGLGMIFPAAARIAAWGCVLMLPLGLNLMVTGLFVRNRNYPGIARLRLVSGVSNFLFVLAACLVRTRYLPLLAIPTAASSLVTALWGFGRNGTELRSQFSAGVRPRDIVFHLRSYAHAALAALLGGAAFQSVGIATPLLGAAANGWAIAVRLGGGFSTVSQQVVAPMFETEFAHHFRAGDNQAAAANQRRAFMLGASYAALCAPAVALVVWLAGAYRDPTLGGRALLLVCAGLFTFAILSTSLMPRNLVIAGGQRSFLRWAAAKVLVASAALAATAGLKLLVALTAIELAFQLIYYWIAARQAARPAGRHGAPGADTA